MDVDIVSTGQQDGNTLDILRDAITAGVKNVRIVP
jgi:hypothetical protein